MPDLGNVCVREHRPGIEIENPAAAKDLLEHALSSPTRRVIFFCSCEVPGPCHRHVVATLVKKAARRRGVDVNVIEWPGGEPREISIDVSLPVLRAVTRGGQTTLAVPHAMTLGVAASLPWGTRAALRAGTEKISVLLGPAHFTGRGAHLKILAVNPAINEGAAFRQKHGYGRLA